MAAARIRSCEPYCLAHATPAPRVTLAFHRLAIQPSLQQETLARGVSGNRESAQRSASSSAAACRRRPAAAASDALRLVTSAASTPSARHAAAQPAWDGRCVYPCRGEWQAFAPALRTHAAQWITACQPRLSLRCVDMGGGGGGGGANVCGRPGRATRRMGGQAGGRPESKGAAEE